MKDLRPVVIVLGASEETFARLSKMFPQFNFAPAKSCADAFNLYDQRNQPVVAMVFVQGGRQDPPQALAELTRCFRRALFKGTIIAANPEAEENKQMIKGGASHEVIDPALLPDILKSALEDEIVLTPLTPKEKAKMRLVFVELSGKSSRTEMIMAGLEDAMERGIITPHPSRS